MMPIWYHSSGSPRLRKSPVEVTIDQSFDLVAILMKPERALFKGSKPRGLDGLRF